MLHKMNLWKDSFESIKSGSKTIEMRLFDEKRSIISIGDEIEFVNISNGKTLRCRVLNLYRYENFEELYKNHDKISIGYTKDEVANPSDMLNYYSKEQIEKYGALAIELIKINNF